MIEIANKHFIPLLEGIYEMPDLTDADEIFDVVESRRRTCNDDFDFRRYAVNGNLTTTIRSAFIRENLR